MASAEDVHVLFNIHISNTTKPHETKISKEQEMTQLTYTNDQILLAEPERQFAESEYGAKPRSLKNFRNKNERSRYARILAINE
jgi:hypothetical protein